MKHELAARRGCWCRPAVSKFGGATNQTLPDSIHARCIHYACVIFRRLVASGSPGGRPSPPFGNFLAGDLARHLPAHATVCLRTGCPGCPGRRVPTELRRDWLDLNFVGPSLFDAHLVNMEERRPGLLKKKHVCVFVLQRYFGWWVLQ